MTKITIIHSPFYLTIKVYNVRLSLHTPRSPPHPQQSTYRRLIHLLPLGRQVLLLQHLRPIANLKLFHLHESHPSATCYTAAPLNHPSASMGKPHDSVVALGGYFVVEYEGSNQKEN